MSDPQDKQTTADDKAPPKSLGLSKVVYGLGMSARDSLVTFGVATAALFLPLYYGQGKHENIDKMAQIPEKVHGFFNKQMGGERAGRAGKALAVAAGLGTLVGYVAHVPGLFRGPKKVREAEETYGREVEENARLYKENTTLTEELKQQALVLERLREQPRMSHTERLAAEPSKNATLAM